MTEYTSFGDRIEWAGIAPDDRDAWLVARRTGIGGSDVPTLMGLGPKHQDGTPWKSELELYAEKIATGDPTDEASEAAEWGRVFEKPILEVYQKRRGIELSHGGVLLRSKENPHHLLTLDAEEVAERRVVDCKTTGYGYRYKDEIPTDVQIQLQWYMHLTGADGATVVWLPLPERRLQWRDLEPHPDFTEIMLAAVEAFWARVVEHRPPPPDGSASSRAALHQLWPQDFGTAIAIEGEEALVLSAEYEILGKDAKRSEGRRDEIKNIMLATMQDSTYGLLDDGQYWSFKTIAERDFNCAECGHITGSRKSYRTPRLCAPPKRKKLPEPIGSRALAEPLLMQLEASVAALEEGSKT